MSFRAQRLHPDIAFNGVVEGLAGGGADNHFDPGDDIAMFVVPVVAAAGGDLHDGDARIVLAFGEPGFEDGFPQLFNAGGVAGKGGVADEVEEIGMGGALEEEINLGLAVEFLDGVAIRSHEKPETAGGVDFADVHGADAFGLAAGGAGAEKAGFGFIDDVLDTLDGFGAAEVFAIFFRLVLVDGIHCLVSGSSFIRDLDLSLPFDDDRGTDREAAVFCAVNLEAVLRERIERNGEAQVEMGLGALDDLAEEVVLNGGVGEVTEAPFPAAEITEDAAGIEGMVGQSFFEYTDAAERHLEAGGKLVGIGLRRINATGGGFAQDTDAVGLGEIDSFDGKVIFKEAMAEPPGGIFGAFEVALTGVTAPVLACPIRRVRAKNGEAREVFAWQRIAIGDIELNEILCDRFAILGGEGLDIQSAKHGFARQLEFNSVGGRDFAMRERNGSGTAGEFLPVFAERIDTGEAPLQDDVFVAAGGEMGGGDFDADARPMIATLNGGRIDGNDIAFVNDAGIVTELLGSAVVIHKAIVFPLDVVQFGEDVAGNAGVAAKFVGEKFEAPTNVAIAIKGADAAVFAVDEGLAALAVPIHIIEAGAGIGGAHDFLDVLFGCVVIVQIEVPRIDVGIAVREVIEMLPMDDAHVLNEAGVIQFFGKVPHGLHEDMGAGVGHFNASGDGFGGVFGIAFGNFGGESADAGSGVGSDRAFIARIFAEEFYEFDLSPEAPGFVKKAPGKNRRMIEIALDRFAHHRFVAFPTHGSVAPFTEIWEIAHKQDAHGVGVIEEERIFDFDVNAEKIETDLLGEGDISAEAIDIARRVDAFRIVGLMEDAAMVASNIVEAKCFGLIRIFGGSARHFAHAKIGLHVVEGLIAALEAKFDAIKIRFVGIPKEERFDGDFFERDLIFHRDAEDLTFAFRRGDFYFDGGTGGRVFCFDPEICGGFFNVCGDGPGGKETRATWLDIDGLPDAAAGGVPAPLFPDGLLMVIHGVFHAEDDGALARTVRKSLECIGNVEFGRKITAFLAAEMAAVAPAIQEVIGSTNDEDDALVLPGFCIGNFYFAAVPSDLVAGCEAMVLLGDFERTKINAGGVIIFVAGRIGFAPGGERFPAERDNNLLAPDQIVGLEPFLLFADASTVEAELPWAVKIEPVVPLNGAALEIRARILWARIRGGVQHGW